VYGLVCAFDPVLAHFPQNRSIIYLLYHLIGTPVSGSVRVYVYVGVGVDMDMWVWVWMWVCACVSMRMHLCVSMRCLCDFRCVRGCTRVHLCATFATIHLYLPAHLFVLHMYGVASISGLLKIIGLFCKRALEKRRYSAEET